MDTKPRVYITKSRSGHYHVTIKDAGGFTVARSGKCELETARLFAREELAKLAT
jgi:hypothetical protein